MKFADLRLAEPILRSLISENYTTATPIQAGAIPPALEGRDILGCAQTGTGKTAAFALPILHRLAAAAALPQGTKPRMRCLVLCPTRELATQIADGFEAYGKHLKLYHATVFGGVNQHPQVRALRHGTDIIIATPGRFLDLMRQGHTNLSGVETLVLDEADRMLDMGFINDIRTIVAELPAKRQTMLFSATMPREIRKLAESLLKDPVTVQIAPSQATRGEIIESVYLVERQNKPQLLAHLVKQLPIARAIVFTRTKHGADRVVRQLHTRGIRAEAIHGNKSQNARQRALDNFKIGKVPMLVATDIASRGIDVDDVTHVVNYDLTHEPETYVHRIGRTGRAGASGCAISLVDREEQSNLRAIERLIGHKIPVSMDQPVYTQEPKSESRSHEASDWVEDRGSSRSRGHSRSSEQSESRGNSHPRRQSATAGGRRADAGEGRYADTGARRTGGGSSMRSGGRADGNRSSGRTDGHRSSTHSTGHASSHSSASATGHRAAAATTHRAAPTGSSHRTGHTARATGPNLISAKREGNTPTAHVRTHAPAKPHAQPRHPLHGAKRRSH